MLPDSTALLSSQEGEHVTLELSAPGRMSHPRVADKHAVRDPSGIFAEKLLGVTWILCAGNYEHGYRSLSQVILEIEFIFGVYRDNQV